MFLRILYAIAGLIEGLITLRFVLRILGANPSSGFVDFIYSLSTPLVAPFAGIFGQDATIGRGAVTSSVFDWSALVALIFYAIIFAVIGSLFSRRGRYLD